MPAGIQGKTGIIQTFFIFSVVVQCCPSCSTPTVRIHILFIKIMMNDPHHCLRLLLLYNNINICFRF
jgi:hypothetical protein